MELQYHLNLRGMSGRVVRFRVLDQDEIDEHEANGARAAGENASSEKMRGEQLKILLPAMLVAYTDPGQEPARVLKNSQKVIDGGVPDLEKLATAKWTKADAGALALHWKQVFGHKETQALKVLYTEHHEISVAEMQMLQGKALPVATEG